MSDEILGKGLRSLIPEDINSSVSGDVNVIKININDIELTNHQPRKTIDDKTIKELSSSIKEYGIIQPIIVSRKKEGGYSLIAGQRRLLASKEAEIDTIPAIIKKSSPDKEAEIALVENIQREDLNPLEEALAYKYLLENFGLTSKDVALRVGKAESTVINSTRLLGLADEVKKALISGQITAGHARALVTLPFENQIKLLEQIIKGKLTVRDIESKVKAYSAADKKKGVEEAKSIERDSHLDYIAQELREILGTKVIIQNKGKGAKITIDCYSKEEFEKILEMLKGIKESN